MMLDCARTLLAAAGLLLPGLGWARAFRWRLPWFAGGMVSILAIFTGVLIGTIAGLPVTFGTLSLWLTLVGLPGWWCWWHGRAKGAGAPVSPGCGEWWLALPVLPLLAVAVWRAWFQPLSGADASFRWNLLAELLVEMGSLGGYPPMTSADFTRYFWADGIAPLVSSLYAWIYLAGGSTAKTWTAIVALAQTAGLLGLLFALGRQWQGPRAGWFALAFGGMTMLLQFAFNLGQETGLTALGTGGMVFYLWQWLETKKAGALVPAAVCAAVSACAREYGAVAAIAATAWILFRGCNWRLTAGFALGAALLPAIWQGRVFLLTGNPVFAQSFAGFPTNPVFDDWMKTYRLIYGDQLHQPGVWWEIGRMLMVTALPALAGLIAGLIIWRTHAGAGLVLLLTIAYAFVWIASVPFTAGGLFYSMRVLSPILVLGCAWGGAALALWVPGRTHLAGVMLGLTLFACDASLRAWTIPLNPYTLSPREWSQAGNVLQTEFEQGNIPFIQQVARTVSGRVLSDSAGLRDFFHREGKNYSPFWTPEVAWLFSGQTVPHAAGRLRALGFSHLLVKRSSITFDFLAKTGALPSLRGHLRTVMANDTFILLEVQDETVTGEAPRG